MFDGEQQRSEMYAWAIAHANGFEFRGSVRSFDNKYYSKAAVVGPVSLKAPFHNDEYRLLREAARRPVKVPVTGPYTLAAWSFDERYRGQVDLGEPLPDRRRRHRAARRDFVLDLARDLVRPNVEALLAIGATWIQIDEPAGSTEPSEIALMAEAYDACVSGLDGTFSTHLCFSDYDLFFPTLEQMTGCQQYACFANYDSRDLWCPRRRATGLSHRPPVPDLPGRPALGLGARYPHRLHRIAQLVRDRILYAVEVFGGPDRIQVMLRLRAAHPNLGRGLSEAGTWSPA